MNKVKFAAVMSAAAIFMTGCAGSGSVVATVGEDKITSNDVEFFISECTVPTGDRAEDVQDAVDTLVENSKIIQVAEKIGQGLTDEEQANLKSKIESVRKQYGGVKEYDKMIKEWGISDNFIENLLTVTTLKEKLTDSLVDAEFTDDDRKEYFDEHYYFANHILIMTMNADTGDPLTDDEKAEAEKKAKDIYEMAKTADDFDALASEYSEDPGNGPNPKGYIFTDGDMVKEFEDCVKSLEPGEVGFCESDYGYHIIKRYALDADREYYDHNLFDAENAINTALTDEIFDERLDSWCEENGISFSVNDSEVEKLKAKEPKETEAPEINGDE